MAIELVRVTELIDEMQALEDEHSAVLQVDSWRSRTERVLVRLKVLGGGIIKVCEIPRNREELRRSKARLSASTIRELSRCEPHLPPAVIQAYARYRALYEPLAHLRDLGEVRALSRAVAGLIRDLERAFPEP